VIFDRWSYAGMAFSLFSLGFIASTAIAVAQEGSEDVVGAPESANTCECPEAPVCPPEGYALVSTEEIHIGDALQQIQQAREAMEVK
jgi:hypothetical protein